MATKQQMPIGAATLKRIFPDWEVKERIYVLKKKATPLSFQLRSRHTKFRDLQWYDPELGYPRAMRYVTNQIAIFTDEQNEDNLRLGAILFEDGKLVVPANNTALQQFLALHPDNIDKGGRLFYEFDPDKAARQELEKEMKGFEAVAVAMDLEIEDIEAIARVIFGKQVDQMTSGEIKRDVVMFAKNKPDQFMKVANNSNIRMMNLAQKAINLGILKLSDDNVTLKWAANGKEITKLPFSAKPMETLAAWMKTDEGLKLVESLSLKMGA